MNFKNIIEKLVLAGLTQQAIARACGCSQPTISDILTGKSKDTKSSIALALLDLSKQRGV